MRLQLLGRKLTSPAEREACESLEGLLKLAVQRLRRLTFELRPVALDDTTLARAAVRRFTTRSILPVRRAAWSKASRWNRAASSSSLATGMTMPVRRHWMKLLKSPSAI